ncbi:MAG: hypothetical protein NZM44_05995 [Candidatus Calescibacterium sp.]|nr:hypothetical protein [Candidatus Calescibacterium sp.]
MRVDIMNYNLDCAMVYSAELDLDTGEIFNQNTETILKQHNADKHLIVRYTRYQDNRFFTVYYKEIEWTIDEKSFNQRFGVGSYTEFLCILVNYRKVPNKWLVKMKNFLKFLENLIVFRIEKQTEVDNV